eukprot:294220-Rhodomonas_salina.1
MAWYQMGLTLLDSLGFQANVPTERTSITTAISSPSLSFKLSQSSSLSVVRDSPYKSDRLPPDWVRSTLGMTLQYQTGPQKCHKVEGVPRKSIRPYCSVPDCHPTAYRHSIRNP